ncbi:hypothetical protein Ait01nite_049590 [Actinoplanes italicus]|uniref:Putative ABC transporter-associated repeat protein n=1 Tax=Actinoplanes italicus TaxID=113567 RepID=A0A2T0KAA4_9ACTN|nr:TIGR03773 family transporter-associated surface protein [Actinoplanes italicus]PRX20061.1 putative ABC transporter-associated repeat protein [Actinoplanes italicus]GIE31914.1 hypothetical protein Ait01nite_049590 [Actinoplanes italicus]
MSRNTSRGLRKTIAAGTASLAVALSGGAPAAAASGAPDADGADLVVLSVESGELRMSFRGDGPPREGGAGEGKSGADPGSVRFVASGTPVGVVPGDPAFAFLGRPGSPVWSLQEGSPFSTFDTTGVSRGEVTLELVSVDGPGSFAAYTLSEWGRPTVLLDSDGRKSTRLSAGQRLGGVVWLFDAVGEYRVTLRASTGTGTRALSDEAVYTVAVTGLPPTATPATARPQQAADAEREAPAAQKAAAQQAAQKTAAQKTAAATGKRVIADGHVDMGPQLSGNTLTVRLKDDSTTPPTWRELADVTLKVTDRARIDVPAGDGYAFLGEAGDKVYLLPQSQQAGIVWPGWNTQHESVVGGTKGTVTWRLKQVDGPGEFKLFLTGSFGTPEVVFDSAERLPQQLGIAPNTHAHGNWAFTKAGVYRLTVEMAATTTAGKAVSDTKTLTFAVGDATDAGSGSGGGTVADQSGDLAKTGTDIVSIAGGGALLLTLGTAAVVLTRRRRSDAGHLSTAESS